MVNLKVSSNASEVFQVAVSFYLHQELKRRKEAGEKDLVIKRGKIIKRQAREGPNHSTTNPN